MEKRRYRRAFVPARKKTGRRPLASEHFRTFAPLNNRFDFHDRSRFVGRRDELRRLAALRTELEGHRERPRHLVIVEGFEGAGATSVVAEFLRRLDDDDRTYTARGAYSPALRRAPLEPVVDAVDRLLSSALNDRRLRALFNDSTLRPLLRRLPLVQTMLDVDSEYVDGSIDSDTFVGGLGGLLSHVARFRPVVMSIDNLHLVPEDDLPLLASLNLALRDEAVLVIATARRERTERPGIIRRLEGTTRETIYLPPLSAGEIAVMIANLYGAHASSVLGNDIAAVSQGLPRRALDLLHGLVDDRVLVRSGEGEWDVADTYNIGLLRGEQTSSEKIAALNGVERLILTLLNCRGGAASRSDLINWVDAILARGETSADTDAQRALDSLESGGILRPFLSDPSQVAFADPGLAEAERSTRHDGVLDEIATIVVESEMVPEEVAGWSYDLDLVDRLVRLLPTELDRRSNLLLGLISFSGVQSHESDSDYQDKVFRTLLAHRHSLHPSELAFLILQFVEVETTFARFASALEYARQAYEMTRDDESCAHLRSIACARYALTRFYVDRASDVADLLAEGEGCLSLIPEARQRLDAEFILVKNRLNTTTVVHAREGIEYAARAYRIADQLGHGAEKYTILSDLILRLSRIRDGEQLRRYCGQLLRAMQDANGRPPVWMTSTAIRAALNYGDLFVARDLLSAWNRGEAPLEPRDFIAYSYVISLFALNDGDPDSAAESGRRARREIQRLRNAGASISYEILFNYQAIQIYLIASLVYGARYNEALETVESIIAEVEQDGNTPDGPEVLMVHRFYRAWLRWRKSLPTDLRTSLAWTDKSFADVAGRGGGDANETEFLTLYTTEAAGAAPPPRFLIEMLHAELHAAAGRYEEALKALDEADSACRMLYSFRNDIEFQAGRVTILLRRAHVDENRAHTIVEEAIARARDLFSTMAERGMTSRIELLTRLFGLEARGLDGIVGRDVAAQFDRMGASAQSTARVVLRNSTSEESGPIDRARLSVMGPMRLMRPHSYLELTDTAFGRETARTLIVALVAARLLDRYPSREELALQLSPRSRNPEQSKKNLYNAASAARAACGSPDAILNIGSGSMELNTDPDRNGSIWVDALEIRSSVLQAERLEKGGERGAALDLYRRALFLARRGEFAVDCYHEWIDPARDALRELVRRAALAVATIAVRAGQYPLGIDAASTQLLRDPYDEEAHRLLIRLYAESGNRSAALKQYEKCRKLIRREYGVDLEPETTRLLQTIRS